MKKQTYFTILAILFIIILASPFLLWQVQPSKKLNMLIMDKTVPNQTYQEHKGLVWILNNEKFLKENKKTYSEVSDYKGFKPKKGEEFSITPLPKNLDKYDVYYLTDQYGVYKEDFNLNYNSGVSTKIYGGLESGEVDQIEKVLLSNKGKTIIAEFNTFANPTSELVRSKISNLLNLDWTGWIGRYFSNLNSTEVPKWVKTLYEEKNKKWNFSGEGFIFVSKSDDVIVIEQNEMKENGLLFSLTKKGAKHFNQDIKAKYQYWFDINNARRNDEVLATYELPVTSSAEKKLQAYGIPTSFPAVIYHKNAQYSSYYFAGDYADEPEIPGIYQTLGFDFWKKHLGPNNSFFWEAYVPMMKDILNNGLQHVATQEQVELAVQKGIKLNSRVGDSYIQVQRNGKWEDFLIKGVNMGIAKPGYFPGETAITKEEYMRWFKSIGDMNANSIRIYTLHPPQFYEAFYQYNQMAEKPLYLFHGAWVNEENLLATQDAFAKVNDEDAKTEIKNMIDIIHGNAELPVRRGHASGVYKCDISKYVLGIIVGTEWDPNLVKNTNDKHINMEQFNGTYFKTTIDASPFEVWLGSLMDYASDYEAKQYNWQHSISFTNWVTTDLLEHPSEPLEGEDLVSVNPNHIGPTDQFHAGVFASYHIYPYYPDFLSLEDSYINYEDSTGKKNNYAGYLHDLIKEHEMPVLVAEFGVPSSRGLTHENVHGMNQGFHSETEQGEINSRLYKSIVAEGYAGGIVFSWQDEWFKRTWNTMDLDNPDRRPYWNNQQTNEQHFGLLGFEPGKKETAIIVDGEDSDWELADTKSTYLSKDSNSPLSEVRFSSDSGYLYFLLTYNRPVDFQEQGTYLLLDTIGNQGQTKLSLAENTILETDYGIDFLVKLFGPKNSRIMVDSYYDSFYFQYAFMQNMIKQKPQINQKNNGFFHPIRLALSKEQTVPTTGTKIPFQDYETGALRYGNANPMSKEFDSLTDISISETKKIIEGRIPWQLLNVKDPSLKEVMGDFWKGGLSSSEKIEGIRVALVTTEQGKINQTLPNMANGQLKQKNVYLYNWNEWDLPSFYERLKKSYQIIKETYQTTNIDE